jgi:hypothetical protein
MTHLYCIELRNLLKMRIATIFSLCFFKRQSFAVSGRIRAGSSGGWSISLHFRDGINLLGPFAGKDIYI